MSDVFCVTDRRLCRGDLLARLEEIAAARPAGIILREKDLSETEYARLAEAVLGICKKQGVPCILHSFYQAAAHLGVRRIHLPLPLLRQMSERDKAPFHEIGASCHSVQEARLAQSLGCSYILAGHVFPTDCKKGVPGRGLPFLEEMCAAVTLPVLAIGGIDASNAAAVRRTGVRGICLMSTLMTCENIPGTLARMEEASE